ncbi:MAG: nucleotidyltransferase domain-containing protein [Mariprofundales bacterium]
MRLSPTAAMQIVQYAKLHFGNDISLYLFGSRVDDQKKGGDIDLFIATENTVAMRQQTAFLKDIYRHVTQRKTDLLVHSSNIMDKTIFHTAKETGIPLC